jgi:predicted metal-dependent phosphoesterase TrpH
VNEVDLHCHTSASDGALSPARLVARAARLALKVIAVTDHDSTDGVEEALSAGHHCGVEVIPGVEINTDVPGTELHMLGYYLDHTDPVLQSELARLREGRIGRARRMAEVLSQMGAPLSFERILEIAGEGAVGRPHVAQALLEAGHVATYDERMKFTPVEACMLIRRAGGLPVLAHPVTFDRYGAIKTPFDLDERLPTLKDAGLMGIEVYYPGYDAITIEFLLHTARRHGLLVTGGTDFHGIRPTEPDLGAVYIPIKTVRRLKSAWEHLQ